MKKGVSMIALIITIVVIVILSAVVILNLTGNNNIISNAKKATEESNKETAKEAMNLKLTVIQMNSYTKNQRIATLQETANILSEDSEIEYVDTVSKNSSTETASLTADINIGNSSSIYTKLKEFPYEFEINDSLQLASIDGVNLIASNDDSTVTVSKEEFESLKNEIRSLKSKVDSLENKTIMKTQTVNKLETETMENGSYNPKTELVKVTIDEDCYANVYARYAMVNDDSPAYKGIFLYVNNTLVAYNGKGGIGGNVHHDTSFTKELKKGDVISLRGEQYAGSAKKIISAGITVNYFPKN